MPCSVLFSGSSYSYFLDFSLNNNQVISAFIPLRKERIVSSSLFVFVSFQQGGLPNLLNFNVLVHLCWLFARQVLGNNSYDRDLFFVSTGDNN